MDNDLDPEEYMGIDPEEFEAQAINSFAFGGNARATDPMTLATKHAMWIVEGDDFSLVIGDANLTTPLSAHERIVIRGVCERLFEQALEEEDRL